MSGSDMPWIVYVIGCLAFYRFAIRTVRRNMVDPCSCDWGDVVGCVFFGIPITALWPVWIIPEVAGRLAPRLRRRQPRTPEEFLLLVGGQSKAERLKRQADRIAELERELNVGGKS